MISWKRWCLVAFAATIIGFYLFVIALLLRPRVSEEYRAYFIDRSTLDWRPIRYRSDVTNGIDFSQPGLPDFVQRTTGISAREKWGRWTDARLGKSATVVLKDPIWGSVCVSIDGFVTPKQRLRPLWVRFGGNVKKLYPGAAGPYRMNFFATRPSSELQITPSRPGRPREWDDGNRDARKISLALKSVTFEPGLCK
jgi:hypothetical protein